MPQFPPCRPATSLRAALLLAASSAASAQAQTATVPFYHNSADHAGMFVVPGLTAQTVGSTVPDTAFDGSVPGVINAAPLYWRPKGATSGTVIVATENDTVAALDETTGKPVWQTQLGTAATPTSGCGNINPIGVTGTPVIDAAAGVLYLDAVVGGTNGGTHMLFGLSLATGAVLAGFPVAVGPGITAKGQTFVDSIEEQRGALALLGGQVYVPFGGYDGDCGDYHGIVAGFSTSTRAVTGALTTTADKGGVWAAGGIVTDGTSLYFATGNTSQATNWSGGEGVIHAQPNLAPIRNPKNYFAPSNWKDLDNDDYDLGGSSPTLINLPGATPSNLLLALGKDGNAYLLNRAALGGISTALQTVPVSGLYMHTSTARYTVGSDVMVAFNASAPGCAGQTSVIALRISASPTPQLASAWCTPLNGRGNPIVTTTDGTSNPIVWVAGAEGDEELHAYAGDTGAALYSSPAAATTVAHFSTLLVANGKIFVPSQNKLLAYTLGH